MTENLLEMKKNIIEKTPKLVEYSIGNFSQLSSIDRLYEITLVLKNISNLWHSGIFIVDSEEEYIEHFGKVRYDNVMEPVKELNDIINVLFAELELKFSPVLEARLYKDIETVVVSESEVKVLDVVKTETPIGDAW